MAVDPALRQRILETYPAFGWLVDVPEVGDLLARASTEGWDLARLQASLYATNWWRTRSESQRQAETLAQTDPATYQQQFNKAYYSLQDYANQLGVAFTEPEVRWFSTMVGMRGGAANDEQQRLGILSWVRAYPGRISSSGSIYQAANALDDMYRSQWFMAPDWNYLVGIGAEIALGYQSEQNVRDNVAAIFSAATPHLADRLKAGETYADIVNPYRDMIARELELGDLNAVDMVGSNEWRWLLGMPDPDKPEVTRLPTQQEVIEAARKDPRWNKTIGATSLTTSLVDGITRAMGARA